MLPREGLTCQALLHLVHSLLRCSGGHLVQELAQPAGQLIGQAPQAVLYLGEVALEGAACVVQLLQAPRHALRRAPRQRG